MRIVVASDYLLTVRAERLALPAVLGLDLGEEHSKTHVVYTVLDAILETAFVALEELDLMFEGLAETWDERRGGVPRRVLRAAGARLATMRRWATAQQAVVERCSVEIGTLRGFESDDEPYFDRLEPLVDRLPPSIDAAADAMGTLRFLLRRFLVGGHARARSR